MRQKVIECLNCGVITTRVPGLRICTVCGSSNVELTTFDPLDPDDQERDEEGGADEYWDEDEDEF